jgi:hypothetical protein
MDVAFRRFSFNVLDGAQKVSAPRIMKWRRSLPLQESEERLW